MPTLGAGFKTKEVEFTDPSTGSQQKIKLNLWDTAGQEKFDSLTKMYFKDTKVALIVYDVTSDMSFEKAQRWVKELEDTEKSDEFKIIKFLIGNKCDCVNEQEVGYEQGAEYARKIGATFFETSAKENRGIKELFEDVGL